jgi:hypothetical protein
MATLMKPVLGLAIVALGATMTLGCAADEGDDASNQNGAAISADQAASATDFQERVAGGFAAGAAAQEAGITSWSVYAASKDAFEGAILFATNAANDVRYAILLNGKNGDLHIIAYNKAGETSGEDIAPLDRPAVEMLLGELPGIVDLLKQAAPQAGVHITSGPAHPVACGFEIAFGVLFAATAVAVAVAGGLEVAAAAGVATLAASAASGMTLGAASRWSPWRASSARRS